MFREIGCDYCFWTIHFRCTFLLFSIVFTILFLRNRQSIPSAQSKKLKMSINTDHDQVTSWYTRMQRLAGARRRLQPGVSVQGPLVGVPEVGGGGAYHVLPRGGGGHVMAVGGEPNMAVDKCEP